MIDGFTGDYWFLSNFYCPCSIMIEGVTYPSTEHAFQAAKATTPDDHHRILACATPGQAKRLGRRVPCRPDWEQVKDDVMLACLHAKFSPGSDLAQRLLNTGDEVLVEKNSWHDTYWGVYQGKGRNRLGHLLMQVRSELRRGHDPR